MIVKFVKMFFLSPWFDQRLIFLLFFVFITLILVVKSAEKHAGRLLSNNVCVQKCSIAVEEHDLSIVLFLSSMFQHASKFNVVEFSINNWSISEKFINLEIKIIKIKQKKQTCS